MLSLRLSKPSKPLTRRQKLRALTLTIFLLGAASPAFAIENGLETSNTSDIKATLNPQAPDAPIAANRNVRAQIFPINASLRVNGVQAGDIEADVSMAGYVGLNPGDLARSLDGKISTSLAARLSALAPEGEKVPASVLREAGIDVAYDAGALAINVVTPLEGAPINRISVNGTATPDPRKFQKPAFIAGAINYAVTQNWTQNERDPVQIDVRGFASVGRQHTYTLIGGGRWSEESKSWIRDPVRVVHDDFDRAIRYSAGEVEAGGTGWQSGGQLKGFVVRRAYGEIRPLDTLSNTGRSQFTLERDARVTIQSDGEAPQTLELSRGRYDLRDLTSRIGRSSVKVTAEDATGTKTVTQMAIWNDSVILDPSVSDFSVGLGKLDRLGRRDMLAFTSFYRRGLTPRLTGGGGVDVAGKRRMGQIEGAARIGSAALSAQAAFSSDGRKSGLAVSTALRQFIDLGPDRGFEAYASASTIQKGFARPLDPAPRATKPRVEGEAGLLYRDRANSVSATISRFVAEWGVTRAMDVDAIRTVGRLSFGAGFRFEDRPIGKGDLQGRLRIILRAGKPSAPVTITASEEGLEARADRFGDDRVVGTWTGSAAISALEDDRSASFDGAYEANRFRLTARHSEYEPKRGPVQRQTSATIASSIAFADGAVAIGRPIEDSFLILKRHPSLGKATATISDGSSLGAMVLPGAPKVEQRLFAKSGTFGPPVVSLRSYREESYDLTAENAPDGYDFGSIDPRVVAAAGKGYVARLGKDDWRAAVGELRTAEGPVANLRISVVRQGEPKAAARSGFTNAGGRFYVDGLNVGRYAIRIGDVEVATFEIRPDAPALTDLGVLHAAPF